MKNFPCKKSLSGRAYSIKRSRQGFTLVELSMAMLALSILFAIIFGVYFSLSRITASSGPLGTRKGLASRTIMVMRKTINNSYYIKNVDRLVFVGKKIQAGGDRRDTLTFAAVHPGADTVGVASVREVSYYIADVDSVPVLMKREDTLVDNNPGEGGTFFPLLDNVEELSFRYSLNGKDWVEEWNSKKRKEIPRLIQIHIKVKEGEISNNYETLASPGVHDVQQKSVL